MVKKYTSVNGNLLKKKTLEEEFYIVEKTSSRDYSLKS